MRFLGEEIQLPKIIYFSQKCGSGSANYSPYESNPRNSSREIPV